MDSNNTTSKKLDVYQIVTDRVIALLEKGTVPWQRPWTVAGPPRNLLSKRQYRGINFWLLLSLNYEHNLFLTWDQLKSIGGSVFKDETGHVVVFWKNVKKQPEELDENNQPKMVPMLRYYKVFNIAQCRDIKAELLPEAPVLNKDFDSMLECEAVINGMPDAPVIKHKEQKAYYHPLHDFINMPRKKSFKPAESYYSTLFHELVHSTGHEKRLNRDTVGQSHEFGSEPYSIEELIAEMGTTYLCGQTGILNALIDNSAAYINSWLGRLRGDKRFIVQAAGQAQRAVDFILSIKEEGAKGEVEQSELIAED